MVDLIIPYYNNPDGLLTTLNSIEDDVFTITIIDDGSNIQPPLSFKVDQYCRYKMNSGPGFARQYGINKTSNPYIMFIDTGDVILLGEQQKILQTIKENPNVDVFAWLYYYKDELTKHSDNRMHGKVYKREFLDKYGVTFCAESSYMDEDVGFNRTCRLLTDFYYIDEPIIQWIENTNSLTQKDNQATLYRDQTRALSLNAIHTIETCRKNNIDASTEINQIAVALYYWFLRTIIERPEFIQEAWDGAKIFYDYFKNDINPHTLILGNPEIKKCLKLRQYLKAPINILNFAKEMRHCENYPTYYLT